MKWLEGWFGTMSGVLGALIVVLSSLLAPVSSQGEQCLTVNGSTQCSSTYGSHGQLSPPGTPIGALILTALVLLLFIGVFVGTWLDLRGRRQVGRLILLISASLLGLSVFILPAALASADGGAAASTIIIFMVPLFVLAFITGILACVRPDELRSVAVEAPGAQS